VSDDCTTNFSTFIGSPSPCSTAQRARSILFSAFSDLICLRRLELARLFSSDSCTPLCVRALGLAGRRTRENLRI
jgi:hypothetical protein